MKNLRSFSSFKSLNEGSNSSEEAKSGIHPAIRSKILKFVRTNKGCSYQEAKKYISKEVDGWNLSKDDFEEACQIVKK